MRIAIVEDETAQAEILISYLNRFAKETATTVDCRHFEDGLSFTDSYRPEWDLILLDIEMPKMDGMKAARLIREHDPDVLIIFVTQMARYAIEGYSVQALDYVLKPVSYYAFLMKMNHVLRILQARPKDTFLMISSQSGRVRIPANEIRYIEVQNHTLCYHTSSGMIASTASASLSTLAGHLNAQGFARCHNSFLVNLHHVTGYEKNAVLLGTDRIPLSRTYSRSFLDTLLNYWRKN